MAKTLLKDWWQARMARQREIDASIVAKAEFESLFDKPYQNKNCVRVAGPFTVESLSPHRMMAVDEDDELIDTLNQNPASYPARQTFPQMILDNLKTAGVQQANKADKMTFTGAFQSDVALLGCDIQIPPNPPFSKGGMRTVSLFGQSAVFVPPLKKGG
jgi:adenine-specific DNA-methyltransferase